MKANNDTQRNPWTAVALNLLLPGLGQVYCGTLLRGLVFMALSGAAMTVALVPNLSGAPSSSAWLAGFLLIVLVVFAFSTVDAWRLSRRTRQDFRLKEYNRWQVYALLVVIASGGALGYAIYVRDSLLHPFMIPNQSMYPSIRAGDRILAGKNTYLERDPERGEVIVFRNPENRRQHYVKRVVALAGETVEVKGGELYVNGERAPREAAEERTFRWKGENLTGTVAWEGAGERRYRVFNASEAGTRAGNNAGPVIVPKHHVYVLGDNRGMAKDSRHFGPIPVAGLVGKVGWITLPGEDWSRMGRFESGD